METSEFAVLAFTHDETATPQKLTHYVVCESAP